MDDESHFSLFENSQKMRELIRHEILMLKGFNVDRYHSRYPEYFDNMETILENTFSPDMNEAYSEDIKSYIQFSIEFENMEYIEYLFHSIIPFMETLNKIFKRNERDQKGSDSDSEEIAELEICNPQEDEKELRHSGSETSYSS